MKLEPTDELAARMRAIRPQLTATAKVRAEAVQAAESLLSVLAEVAQERGRQDEKWGEQNHPIHWPLDGARSHLIYKARADEWKTINAARVRWATERGAPRGFNCSWDGILLEEVYEALAEGDPAKIRAEAIQAAAVLVAMIECVDRNGWVKS